MTLDGRTAADSLLLRRPDLLASLITYWQNHPALSYLFSGMFIGPTSQSPRVDEARDDNLYELEIALQQLAERLPAGAESEQPWLVDRMLRNFLVDLTGNTHRTEFSFDKLYSPDGPAGRLGLLELHAFEMPPHARMSLVQLLLLRSLVARFWKTPYTAPLIRWGTQLHDRFMLPHFVQSDLADMVRDIHAAGYPVRLDWLAPFLEFHFTRFGTVVYDGIELEVHQGIEPWHVLGEEMAGTGTARYVDSSVERLQVKVRGLVPGRHAIACNRRMLPLTPTGVPGEDVAGVRYRAWAPWSALHPTIPVHTPLVIDIVDTHAKRDRRLHLSRVTSRRTQLRHTPGKRQRSRSPPFRAILESWPEHRHDDTCAGTGEPRVPGDARPATHGGLNPVRVVPGTGDCFVAALLAMTSTAARHCERIEAISRGTGVRKKGAGARHARLLSL